MERSGTLAEPSDNSTTPYIKKRPTLLGQPLFQRPTDIRLFLLASPGYMVTVSRLQPAPMTSIGVPAEVTETSARRGQKPTNCHQDNINQTRRLNHTNVVQLADRIE